MKAEISSPLTSAPRPARRRGGRTLDLDKLGAHLAGDLRAERLGDVLGEIGHHDTFEQQPKWIRAANRPIIVARWT